MLVALPLVSVAAAAIGLGATRHVASGHGWRETVLHRFGGPGSGSNDGSLPMGPLIFDQSGTLYGTTSEGGPAGAGTVFSLAPTSRTETVLYAFTNSGSDGAYPQSGLHFGPSGALFGTTTSGGVYCHGGLLCVGGTVYSLMPPPSGQGNWSEDVLVSFYGQKVGGDAPRAGVIVNSAGAVFGAAQGSFRSGAGTAFELTQSASGWTEDVMHAFPAYHDDGESPGSDLIADPQGVLYGTTISGGTQRGVGCPEGCGAVYKLYPRRSRWREALLHSFTGANGDGSEPFAGLLMDASGALYGTTYRGGDPSCPLGCGIVFELQPPAKRGGVWTETIIHEFANRGGDGNAPLSMLIQDASGALYGTTSAGGSVACGDDEGCGTVFKLTPPAKRGAPWKESILYSFTATNGDGWDPTAGLVQGADGSLYGTTYVGGVSQCPQGCGIVFKLSPR